MDEAEQTRKRRDLVMMALGSWLTLDTSISVFYSGCGSVQQWGSEWKKSRSSTIMTQCLRIHQKCLIWIVICSNLHTWFLAPKFKYIYVDNKHSSLRSQCFVQKGDFLSDFSTLWMRNTYHMISSLTQKCWWWSWRWHQREMKKWMRLPAAIPQ